MPSSLIIEGQERFPKNQQEVFVYFLGGLGMLGGYVLKGRYARSSRYVIFPQHLSDLILTMLDVL